MRAPPFLAPLLLALLLAAPLRAQELAMPRAVSVLADGTIRLSDLFDGLGENGDAALGTAPPPGGRIIVETSQLAAIARARGIAWRPLTGSERVVIERPGRSLEPEEIEDVLRASLAPLGLEEEAELETPGFSPPTVPRGAFVQIMAEQGHLDPASRRFSATLVVAAEGMPTWRQRIAGRAIATTPAVIATRRIGRGEILGPEDVRLVRLRAERLRSGAATSLAEVVGQQARRPLGPELPVLAADVAQPVMIERDALVVLVLDSPGLSLVAQGRALEAAARGETLPVMNLSSRSIVEGVAIAPGRVRVVAGSTPVLRADGSGSARAAHLARRAPR